MGPDLITENNQAPPRLPTTQPALMEHEFGVRARLPPSSSDACSGREGDSLRVRSSISKDKDLLVSGDIFNESAGKYVIAEADT